MKLIRIENLVTRKFTFKYIAASEHAKIAKCRDGLIIRRYKLTAL